MKHSLRSIDVPRETFSRADALFRQHEGPITDYIDQLLWWNERLNLVSRDVSRETITEHVRHSLLLGGFPAFQEAPFVVDSGTGGGLPGLPLALTHPSKEMLLNDIVTKKVLAVKQMARELGLNNIQTFDGSVAALPVERPFLLISKHAFKIDELYELANGLPWTQLIFYKGADFRQELEGIPDPLQVTAHRLAPHAQHPFYEEKALVMVERP